MEIEIKKNTLEKLNHLENEVSRLNVLKENIIVAYLDALDVDVTGLNVSYDLKNAIITVE